MNERKNGTEIWSTYIRSIFGLFCVDQITFVSVSKMVVVAKSNSDFAIAMHPMIWSAWQSQNMGKYILEVTITKPPSYNKWVY